MNESFKAHFQTGVLTWQNVFIDGLWWWSSSQRARLLLRQSEFESRWGLQFFCKIVTEKNENKQKEAGLGPFKKNVFIDVFTTLGRKGK